MQTKNASNIKIIDVSHYQGSINWPKVKADGVVGVFIKATEGKTGIDAKFSSHAIGAELTGVKVGYYHYARPENNTAAIEAANFFRTIKSFKAHFPYVLDIEGESADLGSAKLTLWCVEWLQEVERLTGHPAMIYTGASFAKSYLGKALNKWPLWIAHYGVDTPMSNNTWDEWAVFQYSSNGKVEGINGFVDMNVMEKAFFDYYIKPIEEVKPKMNQKDAEAIIRLLSASYELTKDKEARAEIHRLANEIRKASGQSLT